MLITCPECELKVSDKAIICPHCGFPLKDNKSRTTFRKSSKRKKLPNGFGGIVEIRNKNLRKPFRAEVTVGKNENNRPVRKILGYYESYNNAYVALAEYNKHPYDFYKLITVEQLYEKWTAVYFKNITESAARTIIAAWRYCFSTYKIPAQEIRARHIKFCMEKGMWNGKKPSPAIATKIKSLWNLMLDYALEFEVVDRNYARTFNISDKILDEQTKATRGHIIFSQEEMEKLWNHLHVPYVNIILMQCYSGWRPQELGKILLEDVDLDNGIMKGGVKSDAGINRVVPIHPKIKNIIHDLYKTSKSLDSKYLITCTDMTTHRSNPVLTYDKYSKRFMDVIKQLNLNPEHRPHDPRKQFASMAKEAGVDPYAVKLLIGHSITDITEKTYTEVSLDWLRNELEKI